MAVATTDFDRLQHDESAPWRWQPALAKKLAVVDRFLPVLAVFIPVLLVPDTIDVLTMSSLGAALIAILAALVLARWLTGGLQLDPRLPASLFGLGLIGAMLVPAMAISKGAGLALVALMVAETLRRRSPLAIVKVALSGLIVVLGVEIAVILFDLARSPILLLLAALLGLVAGIVSVRRSMAEDARSDPLDRFNTRRLLVDTTFAIALILLITCFLAYLTGNRQIELAAGATVWLSVPFAMIAALRTWDMVMTGRAWTLMQLLCGDALFAASLAGWLIMTGLTIGPFAGLLPS